MNSDCTTASSWNPIKCFALWLSDYSHLFACMYCTCSGTENFPTVFKLVVVSYFQISKYFICCMCLTLRIVCIQSLRCSGDVRRKGWLLCSILWYCCNGNPQKPWTDSADAMIKLPTWYHTTNTVAYTKWLDRWVKLHHSIHNVDCQCRAVSISVSARSQ